MSGDVHVRFCERLGVRVPRATHRNVYVRSERAGQRVMASLTGFLTRRLKLQVNPAKSAVARPWARTFLGFSFTTRRGLRRRLAPETLARVRRRIRELTRRRRGVSLAQMVEELSRYLRGWRGYFGFCQTPTVLGDLDRWIRRRLRSVVWRQWRRGRTRYAELRRRGVGETLAACTAGSAHGPWRLSRSPALTLALPNAYFHALGLLTLAGSSSA